VYGLMGLVEKSDAGTLGLLDVDYEKSEQDIYMTVLSFMKNDLDWGSDWP
jgi:hypothetical protein